MFQRSESLGYQSPGSHRVSKDPAESPKNVLHGENVTLNRPGGFHSSSRADVCVGCELTTKTFCNLVISKYTSQVEITYVLAIHKKRDGVCRFPSLLWATEYFPAVFHLFDNLRNVQTQLFNYLGILRARR